MFFCMVSFVVYSGVGKMLFVEVLLYVSGVILCLGWVEDGIVCSDFIDVEKEYGFFI